MKYVANEFARPASAGASRGFERNFMALGEWVAVSNRLIGHDEQAGAAACLVPGTPRKRRYEPSLIRLLIRRVTLHYDNFTLTPIVPIVPL